jgi:hypothetical protein
MATATITGTVGDGATEAEIVAGAGTVIITLTGDTWIAAGGASGDYGITTYDTTPTSSVAGHWLTKVTLPIGTITAIHTYVKDADSALREIQFVIYNDSGSNHPTTLRSTLGEPIWGETLGVATLNERTGLSHSITVAGDYWIGFVKEHTATDQTYDSTETGSSTYIYGSGSFTSPDADLTGLGTVTGSTTYTVWVTY